MFKKSNAHYVRKERKTPENISGRERGYSEIGGVVTGFSEEDCAAISKACDKANKKATGKPILTIYDVLKEKM